MPAPDSSLTAALDQIRKHHQQHVSRNFPEPGICVSRDGSWPCDSYRLLAAIDAVLKQADEWRAVGCPESAEEEALMWQKIECGEALREAILSSLTPLNGQEET